MALIGLFGVLIGAVLGEYFRQRNRIDSYAQKVFERRLQIYEELFRLAQSAYTIADEVMTTEGVGEEERLALVSEAIHSIASYVDENTLYIDTYVALDVMGALMGAENVQSIPDEAEREAAIKGIRNRYKSTRQNLLKESGIHEINKHFKLISRSKPDSLIISYAKQLEKEQRKKK